MKFTGALLFVCVAAIATGLYFFVDTPQSSVSVPHQTEEEINPAQDERPEYYRLMVVLHRVTESGDADTSRSEELVRQIIGAAGAIWLQADVAFAVEVERTALPPEAAAQISVGAYGVFEEYAEPDGKIHVFFVNTLNKTDSVALGNSIVVVADETDTASGRLVAHEIGRLFGLDRVTEPAERLMAQHENGTVLTEAEIAEVQQLLELSISSKDDAQGI